MEEDEYKKLAIEDRCVHKLWKARVNGYEEVTRIFRTIDDEKSPEFAKYLGLVKKFVVDSNAMGQEKGLEATLAYVENYANAGKTVGEVMSGIVNKCIAAPRTKTRELALQVTLMYIEIEKQEAVLEELLKGMEAKNPKIVGACVMAVTLGLQEFGSKVITLKPIVKKIPALFGDRDKDVRAQARALVIEMYRWIGDALRNQISTLQPVQITDLQTEFSKIEGQKAVPTRYIRSQQQRQAKMALEANDCEVVDDETDDVDEPVVIDSYEVADPVDILSKLPKDFYDKIEAKKWQERKETLEMLENLVKTPKLESGDYGDLVRALKKMVQKDSNVVVVALAARCLTGLAIGLKKKFQTYAGACIPTLLEKFKEKKQNVVSAVRDASDAIYVTTTLENILDDVLEALINKNPNVKSETSLFLARSFTKTLPAVLNKKLLKAITGGLIKLLNEPDPTVRESASEALGTLMKLVGEKIVAPFILEIEKDALKMARVREFCENAVIVIKVPGVKKDRPVTVQPKAANKVEMQTRSTTKSAPKFAKRPTAGLKKKPSSEISSGTATIVKSRAVKASKPISKPIEKEISEEEAMEIVGELINPEIMTSLADGVWKNRLNAVEQFMLHIQGMDSNTIPTQALVRVITRKPGLKDTNFQVLKAKLDVIKYLTTVGTFSVTSAYLCINDITEKLGDVKNGATSGEVLSAMSDVIGLHNVLPSVIDFASTQKSPKVLQESLTWMCTAIKEFGFTNLNAKSIIEHAKKALASNNASVRSVSISLFGILYLYTGPNIHVFLENEKQAIRDQINVECEKYENEKPPVPIRGISKSESSNSLDAAEEEEDGSGDSPLVNAQDLFPRIDISSQITESLLCELSDKNWKVRNEALTKVSNIITEAKLIKTNIGDLPQALALRLVDSNTKIAQAALNICENIATAMGPPCKQHIRTLFPGFLQGLGDSKAWIRTASVTCMNTFGDQCSYKDFFESEMIGDALKTGSPTLRSELWAWLAEKLPKIKSVPKEELFVCLPYLYSNLEDRNADVRKNAQECTLGIMIHLGYESMFKQTEKLKPASKAGVIAILEKVRPNLPVKPLPVKKQVNTEAREDKVVRGTRPSTAKAATKTKTAVAKPVARVKKEDELDTSPLYQINNLKNQRTIDETKLKVLKWNFTSPREEFVDLLKDQMTAANFNKTMMMNMFHSDFRYHLKAIDSLMDDINVNPEALMANLDLILKWFTLRFFDTNPSVLLKGLEYLNLVFSMLNDNNYQLVDTEANSFIPYLILKIGDSKDSVRNGVRMVIKQIFKCYGVSRLYSYFIVEGLKSKNARQRAECLDVMGLMLSIYGLSVCISSPAAALKEVAKQISDRDNSVRNAALNCLVQAFFYVGEKIFKMVGQISDKDMSLLEERIKRATKNPPAVKTTKIDISEQMNSTMAVDIPQMNHGSSVKYPTVKEDDGDDYMEEEGDYEEETNLPGVVLPPQVLQEVSSEIGGPFGLDPDVLQDLDNIPSYKQELNVKDFDLAFLDSPVVLPSIDDAREMVKQLSPPKPIQLSDTTLLKWQNSPKSGAEIIFEKNIMAISSTHFPTALQATEQVQEILQSNKSSLMVNYEDIFMTAISNQLKFLYQHDPRINASVSKMYRLLLSVLDSFYVNKNLGKNVSTPIIKELLNQFIILLVDGKLEGCASGDAYVRVVNLQCVKMIERSDHTNIICALVQLLFNCIKTNATPRLTDLVMKCLWRVIKIMPSWPDEIDYDNVLLEVHLFFKEFPTSWWKNKPVDTPLRTIKTTVHSMAKIKGGNLMLHLSKIPNTNDSEMEAYILKLLKSLKLEEVKQVPLKTDTTARRSLTRSTHAQLTDIFQKIGNKEETKEGLNMLYDFLQQYPEADIDPFLKRSSQFFQEYIEKNLKEIELQRKSVETCSQKLKDIRIKSPGQENQAGNKDNQTSEYYKEQLKYWVKKWEEVTAKND